MKRAVSTTTSAMARTTVPSSSRSKLIRSDSVLSGHWIFRPSNPRRRTGKQIPSRGYDMQRREFFGLGEVIGVITNPAETVRSLTESRRLLEEARIEIAESRERAQLRPAHTFSRLPGFFSRPTELNAIQKILEGDPSFTVLFGASSVGKTALLREVLSMPRYHVLHFDLRIAGFNDLGAMYVSLSTQMEQYFAEVAKQDGYADFEKEAWTFKHDRLSVERRVAESPPEALGKVKTSDIARLMELFQSSMLKYWEFKPDLPDEEPEPQRKSTSTPAPNSNFAHQRGPSGSSSTSRTTPSPANPNPNPERIHSREGGGDREAHSLANGRAKGNWTSRLFGRKSQNDLRNIDRQEADTPAPVLDPSSESRVQDEELVEEENEATKQARERERIRSKKRVPVIFFDEAHKLPALIKSTEAMKCILDSMLVLTKQDRLCHVVHATSDPFYQTWLRQLNIMQHCKIITIGDCSKVETKAFFDQHILPRVPEERRAGINFGSLYEAFGGKLAHWSDYITDYVNHRGRLTVERSTHFLQAHALLNLHLLHSTRLPGSNPNGAPNSNGADATVSSGAGFKIYSPLSNQNPHAAQNATAPPDDSEGAAPAWTADFSAPQLLRVMARLSAPGLGVSSRGVPYFPLCRELGVGAVDGMVKGRILELRWTETVTREGAARVLPPRHSAAIAQTDPRFSEATGDWMPVSPMSDTEGDFQGHESLLPEELEDDDDAVIGPVLVPTTPIMRYAMRAVLAEYDDLRVEGSEYASMSDPEEY